MIAVQESFSQYFIRLTPTIAEVLFPGVVELALVDKPPVDYVVHRLSFFLCDNNQLMVCRYYQTFNGAYTDYLLFGSHNRRLRYLSPLAVDCTQLGLANVDYRNEEL